jgi:hypothetical protein
LKDTRHMKAWNSSHESCRAQPGNIGQDRRHGLLYCFAAE